VAYLCPTYGKSWDITPAEWEVVKGLSS
jgi:hypothetical protein